MILDKEIETPEVRNRWNELCKEVFFVSEENNTQKTRKLLREAHEFWREEVQLKMNELHFNEDVFLNEEFKMSYLTAFWDIL